LAKGYCYSNRPSISGKTLGTDNNSSLGLNIWFDAGSDYNSRTDSLGQQSGTFDIAQVQVEPGAVATTFERRPIGMELSLCQRYFQNGRWTVLLLALGKLPRGSTSGSWPVTKRATLYGNTIRAGSNYNNFFSAARINFIGKPGISHYVQRQNFTIHRIRRTVTIMSKVRLTGTTSGFTELTAPAVAGSNTITLPSRQWQRRSTASN
jgi:hypothetical protein